MKGWHNIYGIVRTKALAKCPLMLFRPRALNMTDTLIKAADGRMVNGALVDFGIIVYHNAKQILSKSASFESRQG